MMFGGKNDSKTLLSKLRTAMGGFGSDGPHRGSAVIDTPKNGNPQFKSVGPETPLRNGNLEFKVVDPKTLLPSRPYECPPARDIVLVVDSSGSVGQIEFQQAFKDLGHLIPYLCGFQPNIIEHCDSTRIAVVTYGQEPRLVFDLGYSRGRHGRQGIVQKDLETMPEYLSSLSRRTATGDALNFTATKVLQENSGMRRQSKKTILLLTDGRSNYGSDPVAMASRLYKTYENLTIIAMGIGNDIDYNELKDMTIHRNKYNFLVLLNSYETFSTIVDEITKLLKRRQATDTCTADVLSKKKRK
jgi:hypothetical protein